MFDPHAYCADHGLTVRHIDGLHVYGRYWHHRQTIELQAGMPTLQERCVLTHELAHAFYGDTTSTPRVEARADRWAANRLISVDDVVRAARMWPENPEKWCTELLVTSNLMRVWLAQRSNYEQADALLRVAA